MNETTISKSTKTTSTSMAGPILHQTSKVIQKYGTRFPVPLGLEDKVCEQSISDLNRVLADTMTLRDLYKKCHWQTSGATFYQLHLLFDKHYNEQAILVDLTAERVQVLGGISVSMAKDVAELSQIESPPSGREEVAAQISRLVAAHETIFKFVRKAAKRADKDEDDGTNDLLVSNVIRVNELQTWFISEHLVALSPTEVQHADGTEKAKH